MDGNVVIKNASELVTCSGLTAKTGRAMSDLAVINGGAVVIENGVITAVGRTDDVYPGPQPLGLRGDRRDRQGGAAGFHRLPYAFPLLRGTGRMSSRGVLPASPIWRSWSGAAASAGRVEATRLATKDELIARAQSGSTACSLSASRPAKGKSGYGLDHDDGDKAASGDGGARRRPPDRHVPDLPRRPRRAERIQGRSATGT